MPRIFPHEPSLFIRSSNVCVSPRVSTTEMRRRIAACIVVRLGEDGVSQSAGISHYFTGRSS